jgi:hypothetical protein
MARVMVMAAFLFLTPFLCAIGKKDAPDKPLVIIGTVKIYGNEPHTYALIVAEDGEEYAVAPDDNAAEIKALQGQTLEFTIRRADEPADKSSGGFFMKNGMTRVLSWRVIEK